MLKLDILGSTYLTQPWVRKCSFSSGVRTEVDDMVIVLVSSTDVKQ
jgi:hypothetical protein